MENLFFSQMKETQSLLYLLAKKLPIIIFLRRNVLKFLCNFIEIILTRRYFPQKIPVERSIKAK